MQVLEGWLFLGNVQELGSRLANAFMAAVSTSSAQTVRSVLLTQPALAQRAMAGTTVQDLTRGIPSDIFRTCVARVSLWLGGSGLSSYIARLVKGTNGCIRPAEHCGQHLVFWQQDMQLQHSLDQGCCCALRIAVEHTAHAGTDDGL